MTPEAARQSLLARRAEIEASLTGIENQLEEPVSKDWEEAAAERKDDEVLEALGAAEQAELRRIVAALDRIDNGSWGECAECGEAIAAGRMEAMPDAVVCTACAERGAA